MADPTYSRPHASAPKRVTRFSVNYFIQILPNKNPHLGARFQSYVGEVLAYQPHNLLVHPREAFPLGHRTGQKGVDASWNFGVTRFSRIHQYSGHKYLNLVTLTWRIRTRPRCRRSLLLLLAFFDRHLFSLLFLKSEKVTRFRHFCFQILLDLVTNLQREAIGNLFIVLARNFVRNLRSAGII